MSASRILTRSFVLGLVVVLFGLSSPLLAAATIEIVNLDGPGEGLNDPTPYTPHDGNPATTLGAARLAAVEFAASLWAAQIDSTIPIRVGVSFDSLGGGQIYAVLGYGGPESAFRDFLGAPLAETWYPSALADKLAGVDLAPGDPDVYLQLNVDVDGPTVLGSGSFDYGLDPHVATGDVWFVEIALHELGHGLAFSTFFDATSGAKLLGKDDAYLLQLIREGASPESLAAMSDAQRVAATQGSVQWTGAAATALAPLELNAGFTALGNIAMEGISKGTHFDGPVAPHQLMKAFYNGDPLELELTRAILVDLGWGAAAPCAPIGAP